MRIKCDDGTECNVHANLLLQSSRLFATAISEAAGDQVAKCKEVAAPSARQPVDIYIRWLYSGALLDPAQGAKDDEAGILLLRAWQFGQKIQAADFADSIIDEIATLLFKANNLAVAKLVPIFVEVFANSPRQRRLSIEWLIRGRGVYSEEDAAKILGRVQNLRFCRELAAALLGVRMHGASYELAHVLDPCVYHPHVEYGMPCYKGDAAAGEKGDGRKD